MTFEGALKENHDFFRQKKRVRVGWQQAQCIQRHKSILLGNLRALEEWQKVGIGSLLRTRLSRVLVVQLNSLDCFPQVGVEEPSEVFSRVFDFKSEALVQAAVTAAQKRRIAEAGKTESTHIESCACHSWN